MSSIKNCVKIKLSAFGLYFSKQPAKYDLLIQEMRINLLARSGNVLHIGAHYGQERKLYSDLNLNVIWIESADKPFKVLTKNIQKHKNQKAFKALLGDKNKKNVEFNQATNDASSSIYKFGKDMPNKKLSMASTELLEMKRLDTIFKKKEIQNYTYWNIDVQGAELLVLKGAGKLLSIPKVLDIEVSTREEYEGAPLFKDLDVFLRDHGFIPLWAPRMKSHENIIYIRLNKPKSIYTGG